MRACFTVNGKSWGYAFLAKLVTLHYKQYLNDITVWAFTVFSSVKQKSKHFGSEGTCKYVIQKSNSVTLQNIFIAVLIYHHWPVTSSVSFLSFLYLPNITYTPLLKREVAAQLSDTEWRLLWAFFQFCGTGCFELAANNFVWCIHPIWVWNSSENTPLSSGFFTVI